MSPIPPLGLVAALARFDKDLRIRWGTHQKLWLIEVKAKERQPGWLAEKPSAFGTTPRALDAWAGWREGYCFVTQLAHPITYPWEFLAAHLTHLSLEAHQAKDALIARLDEVERQQEAATQREWDLVNEAGAKELYDRLCWTQGREISTHVAGPNPHAEPRDGYTLFDRRVSARESA